MKSHLIVTSVKDMSRDEWLMFRQKNGVGASDVGTILGLNQYKSSLEFFHERLSPEPPYSVENLARFMGHTQEDFVANLWQYWEGTAESMIANYRAGRIVRRCQRVNGYVQNPKYPWLFVSLDRKINKGSAETEGALELKTIAGYEADKWEAGIPPAHLVQVITQMLVCEFTFGELAVLKDGRGFDVYPFEEMKAIAEQIIIRTKEFWDKVTEAKILLTQKYEAMRSHNMRKADELQQELETLEPAPDGSEAYEKYLKSKFRKSLAEAGVIRGTDADLHTAIELLKVKDKLKDLRREELLHANTLRRRIGDNRKLDFVRNGTVSWEGEPRVLRLNLKNISL